MKFFSIFLDFFLVFQKIYVHLHLCCILIQGFVSTYGQVLTIKNIIKCKKP